VAFSPDGKRAFTIDGAWHGFVWDVTTGDQLMSLPEHERRVAVAAITPDGRLLLTGTRDGRQEVCRWDLVRGVAAGAPIPLAPKSEGSQVNCLAVDPSGRRFAVGCARPNAAHIVDVATGRPAVPRLLHGGEVTAIGFLQQGAIVFTASSDGTVRFWDADSGEMLGRPRAHRVPVRCAAASPDASLLAVGEEAVTLIWQGPRSEPGPPADVRRRMERRCGVRAGQDGALHCLDAEAISRAAD